MIDLKQYGYTKTEPPPDGLLPGRIIAVHKERYELVYRQGACFGRLKTSAYYGREQIFPTVGDFVLLREVQGGDCQITETLPRKSQFIRRDPYAGQQVVAANMDYVFVMTSLNRDFNVNRIERYLVLARQSGAFPVVLLTKADLADDAAAKITAARTVVKDVNIIPISTVTGEGIDRLGAFLFPGKTVVFLGMSGVGKSSLLNALMEREVMAVNAIREDDSRGRHTTTRRQLFMLPSGAMVIDTPGMRTLGMWSAEEGVSEMFADVEALLGSCRFSDCQHQTEPGCAVLAAIVSGDLSAERWENYKKLKRESLYDRDKAAAMREKWARNKSYVKRSRQMRKNEGFKK